MDYMPPNKVSDLEGHSSWASEIEPTGTAPVKVSQLVFSHLSPPTWPAHPPLVFGIVPDLCSSEIIEMGRVAVSSFPFADGKPNAILTLEGFLFLGWVSRGWDNVM